jgi:hypothetical protein
MSINNPYAKIHALAIQKQPYMTYNTLTLTNTLTHTLGITLIISNPSRTLLTHTTTQFLSRLSVLAAILHQSHHMDVKI